MGIVVHGPCSALLFADPARQILQITSLKVSEGDMPDSEPDWESGLFSRDVEYSKAFTVSFSDVEEITALEGLSSQRQQFKIIV